MVLGVFNGVLGGFRGGLGREGAERREGRREGG